MSNAIQYQDAQPKPSNEGFDLLVTTTISILQQLEDFITSITQEQYIHCHEGKLSAIGGHVRHIVEFYQAYLMLAEDPDRVDLCYDDRQRNMALETSRDSVIIEIQSVKKRISTLTYVSRPVLLHSIVEPSLPAMAKTETNLQREGLYLFDHMIHHMALIKMLAEYQGVMLPRSFGLAQSTKAYEKTIQ